MTRSKLSESCATSFGPLNLGSSTLTPTPSPGPEAFDSEQPAQSDFPVTSELAGGPVGGVR